MKFVQARNYTKSLSRRIDLIVIHTMENAETATGAENVAAWFAGPNAPKASAHYCIDSDSVVQCVKDNDVAWHAPGANHNGIGIEHAGKAAQKPHEWSDTYSRAMLERSVKLSAELARKYDIPVKFVDSEGLLRGERGFTGHNEVSKAWKKSTHWDPGPHFPWSWYLDRVSETLDAKPVAIAAEEPRTCDWVRVVDKLGVHWDVSPGYIGPISIGAAKEKAKELGCELPSPELVDLIWSIADLKLEPLTRTFVKWTAEEMSNPAVLADQQRRIMAQIEEKAPNGYRLSAGAFKDVCLKDGKIGLYGWHRPNGKIIQPFYAGHSLAWNDYSQGLRLCRRVNV